MNYLKKQVILSMIFYFYGGDDRNEINLLLLGLERSSKNHSVGCIPLLL